MVGVQLDGYIYVTFWFLSVALYKGIAGGGASVFCVFSLLGLTRRSKVWIGNRT